MFKDSKTFFRVVSASKPLTMKLENRNSFLVTTLFASNVLRYTIAFTLEIILNLLMSFINIFFQAITTQLMVVTCPICRKDTLLNENDKFELPNNHYILQMMDGSNIPPKLAAKLYYLLNIYLFLTFKKN